MEEDPRKASFAPLTPLSFLLRATNFLGDRTAIIHGESRCTYRAFGERVARLAGALSDAAITRGDTVAILAPNIPAMLEAHFAVPMIGAVLNPINVRLDEEIVAGFLRQGDAKLLICDREFLDLGWRAAIRTGKDLPIVVINDPETGLPGAKEFTDYEAFIANSPTLLEAPLLEDEHQPIALLHTSGTTGTPKAVLYSHRGTYLAALSNALTFGLTPDSRFLWTWPMFHSNGLSFIWSVTAVGGVHICARSIDAKIVSAMIADHRVSHFCAAPLVLNMLATDPAMGDAGISHPVNCITGGSPPPLTVLAKLESLGIDVTHQYGASECCGPATIAYSHPDWKELEPGELQAMIARQGVPTAVIDDLMVADPDNMEPVARDGTSLGEIMVRGNAVVDGYYRDEEATAAAFAEGWYHTGDIAVWYEDGSVEIKDRSKDMIISGGENISSVEIENVLFRHPDVSEAAVVARPDKLLFQTPCAFVDRVAGSTIGAEELERHCRKFLAGLKVPRNFVFRTLPKTATGKIRKHALREMAVTDVD